MKGRLKIGKFLAEMKSLHLCDTRWDVVEAFSDYPNRASMCNSLRFVLPDREFRKYDYLFITDVDFLIFNHNPSHLGYFKKIMKNTGQSYAMMRSALRAPKRDMINGWYDKFTRIVGGTVFVKLPEYNNQTRKARASYREILKSGKHDGYDKFRPASYREYDEVMLYRILRDSNLPVPSEKYKFLNLQKFDRTYRDIHLGDFKFPKRRTKKKIRSRVVKENKLKYRELQKDPNWLKIKEFCSGNDAIRSIFKHVDKVLL